MTQQERLSILARLDEALRLSARLPRPLVLPLHQVVIVSRLVRQLESAVAQIVAELHAAQAPDQLTPAPVDPAYRATCHLVDGAMDLLVNTQVTPEDEPTRRERASSHLQEIEVRLLGARALVAGQRPVA